MSEQRTRNFAFILYPESAPTDWLSLLNSFHIPMCISPLHQPDDGGEDEFTNLKPHHHVMIMFSNVKTLDQASKISEAVNGSKLVIRIDDLGGYARYLCHLNDPDKEQFSPAQVICLAGADYNYLIELSSTMYNAIGEMMDFIEQYDIRSFARLSRWAKKYNATWFKALTTYCSYFMDKYIKARTWEILNPDLAVDNLESIVDNLEEV